MIKSFQFFDCPAIASPVRIPLCIAATFAGLIAIHLLFRFILRAALRVNPGAGAAMDVRERVLMRYQGGDFYALVFAWFKIRMDAMFRELPEFVKLTPTPRALLDVGCGFGIAGSWLLETFDGATIYAIDPSRDRVRGAAGAFGDRGRVIQAAAPDFESPQFPTRFDAVFFLDVAHFLPDAGLDLTLRRISARLDHSGVLYLRAPIQPQGKGSLIWRIDGIRRKLTGAVANHRSVEQLQRRLEQAAFEIVQMQMSGNNRELWWFIARPSLPSVSEIKP
ncbi:MAG TPA: class I SAM-dependent methyltransferase [Tepidisphaeraceae bacterium]|jgi:SAM-dependent methyltransferase|nr:class I SAM-dependent methyltransferase [Tepidisphaeraceae bacterium]